METIFPYLNFMQLYILFTFIVAIKYRAHLNVTFLAIILTFVLSEIASLILIYFGLNFNYAYNFSLIIHIVLWLIMTCHIFNHKIVPKILLTIFVLFSITNLLWGEGFLDFNAYTFTIGAFFYIILFIIKSFVELKHENFVFFNSSNYFLLFSPIIFFFGMSFIFSFKSHELGETPIYGNVKLYNLLQVVLNFIYYTFLNLYIYRQVKSDYAGKRQD